MMPRLVARFAVPSLLFILFLATADASQWKIIRVEAKPDRPVRDAALGNVGWDLTMTCNGVRQGTASSTTFDLLPLLDYLKLSKPQELVGEDWEADRVEPFDALDWERAVAVHEGRYVAPTADEVFDHAAAALATFKVPDYADYDQKSVHDAFVQAFAGDDGPSRWLENMAGRVAKKSGQQVQLIPVADELVDKLFVGWYVGTNTLNVLVTDGKVGAGIGVCATTDPHMPPFSALQKRPELEEQGPRADPVPASADRI